MMKHIFDSTIAKSTKGKSKRMAWNDFLRGSSERGLLLPLKSRTEDADSP